MKTVEKDWGRYCYEDNIKFIEENESKIANIYYSYGKMNFVLDENGRKVPMKRVGYQRTNVGFEMEIYIEDSEFLDKMIFSYHHGKRYKYRGGREIFACIEEDGSLSDDGMEFITKQHLAMDKKFFYWLNIFTELLEEHGAYTDDTCGGHMHISGWDEWESNYVYGSLRAFEPMLIAMFGNGEYGIKREGSYAKIDTIFNYRNYERENIFYISSEHFELRFFDGEMRAEKWFERELFVDATVHIGRCMQREGIGRYVNPKDWYQMVYDIINYNDYPQKPFKRMQEEFLALCIESKYPFTDLVEKVIKGKFKLDEIIESRNPMVISVVV